MEDDCLCHECGEELDVELADDEERICQRCDEELTYLARCEEAECMREEGFIHFADPGGRSALRAASAENPRNLPCPNCGAPDRLTPADRAQGYQCDECAEAIERGY